MGNNNSKSELIEAEVSDKDGRKQELNTKQMDSLEVSIPKDGDNVCVQEEMDEDYDSSDSELCSGNMEKTFGTPPVSYNLKLFCSTDETKSRSTKIVIPHTPRTVLDIKLCVEKEFNIPVCCQRITFESHELRDQDAIEQLRIREGDTFTIAYTSDAMVEDIREIIEAMKKMKHFLRKSTTKKQLAKGCLQDGVFSNDIDGKSVKLLASTYFHPSAYELSKANRVLFVSNSGLQVMHQLHEELLRHPWENCPLEMQYLEHAILRVLWNVSAAFSLRMLLLQRPTLEAVMKSLLRVKIPASSYILGPKRGSFESQQITSETLYKAVGTLGNLAEIPECRLAMASRKDVLDQLLATLTCPTYQYAVSLVVSAGLLCLAYSHETHLYLITDNVIEKFDRACNASKHHSFLDEQLLKYFRSVFYSHLLYASASKIPLDLQRKMYEAIRDFLQGATYTLIHSHEKKYGYIWSTVTPFVKLAYFPKGNPRWSFCNSENSVDDTIFLRELEDLCIEIGVFSLQNILLSENARDILIAESLVDYIVCLPWHLSPETKAHTRACDLRIFLSKKLQLKPPSLVNLTKAKLAVTHCGLDKVLKATSLHDIVNSIGH